jgi:membrane fusion protein (multidrug efflux system)
MKSGRILRASLILALTTLVIGCDLMRAEEQPAAPAAPPMPPANVAALKIETSDVQLEFEYVGQVSASREVEIRARVTGIIEKRLYTEGELVKAGSLLFQLEPSFYEVQLAQVEAELLSAEAELKRAERDYRRLRGLTSKSLVSQNEIDNSESMRDLAKAAVKLAQARVKGANINLEYTKVTAPIDGIAGRALKVEGGLAEAGNNSLLTTLAQIDPVYVNFGVSESEQLGIRRDLRDGMLVIPPEGFDVVLYSSRGDDLLHAGELDFQDYKIDSRTGNFAMRATVGNSDGLLAPGQFVKVKLLGAVRRDAIVLPQRAVLDDPLGKFVYVVAQGENGQPIALKRPVVVGQWVNNANGIEHAWIIRSGLQFDEEVVVDGSARIFFPGMPINPTPYQRASQISSDGLPNASEQ